MGNSKYETHVKPYFDDIFYWYSHDWTLKQIAAELCVGRDTFLTYKAKYSDLSDLLKKAEHFKPRNLACKAEKALTDKLADKVVEDVVTEQWTDKTGKVTKQHIKKVKKVILADTTAIIFALKNNDKERYGELQVEAKRVEMMEQQIAKLQAEAEILRDKANKLSANVHQSELLESLINLEVVSNPDLDENGEVIDRG